MINDPLLLLPQVGNVILQLKLNRQLSAEIALKPVVQLILNSLAHRFTNRNAGRPGQLQHNGERTETALRRHEVLSGQMGE